ncbi:MAG: GNAT family N-acetyltransferase [Clostridia bacterium]|nr:GNAT family N-acetyltransferase [Clostridia bacterium]
MHKIKIEKMIPEHIPQALTIWENQLERFCSDNDAYRYWCNDEEVIDYIQAHVMNDRAVIALVDDAIVGYMAYDAFIFHGAPSVFVPYVGNATILDNRKDIYQAMYSDLAKIWVQKGFKNHYATVACSDDEVISTLYNLGFGSYLIDAYASLKKSNCVLPNDILIRKATPVDLIALSALVKESESYYAESPTFLIREDFSVQALSNLVDKGCVLIAEHLGNLVGFINISINDENNVICMSKEKFAMLDEIGAYIVQDYRGRGIGKRFVEEVATFCSVNNLPCAHVDYETANPYANYFWKKYFKPALLSVKRTIHDDN